MILQFGRRGGRVLQSTLMALLVCLMAGGLAACDSGSTPTPVAQPSNPNNRVATAPASNAQDNTPKKSANSVGIILDDYKILPNNMGIPAGNTSFLVTNSGSVTHNLAIYSSDGKLVGKTPNFKKAEGAKTLTLDLQPGTYKMICDIPGHEAKGMTGVLNVSN